MVPWVIFQELTLARVLPVLPAGRFIIILAFPAMVHHGGLKWKGSRLFGGMVQPGLIQVIQTSLKAFTEPVIHKPITYPFPVVANLEPCAYPTHGQQMRLLPTIAITPPTRLT